MVPDFLTLPLKYIYAYAYPYVYAHTYVYICIIYSSIVLCPHLDPDMSLWRD